MCTMGGKVCSEINEPSMRHFGMTMTTPPGGTLVVCCDVDDDTLPSYVVVVQSMVQNNFTVVIPEFQRNFFVQYCDTVTL